MTVEMENPHTLRDTERAIDTAYAAGDYELAQDLLRRSTEHAFRSDTQNAFYSHAIKYIASPNYADLAAMKRREALNETEQIFQTYKEMGEVLDFLIQEQCLHAFEDKRSENNKDLRGSLAEVVVFGIGARLRILGPSLGIDSTLIPTSVAQDMGQGGLSSDFTEAIRQGKSLVLCPFQSKFYATPEDIEAYDVPVVSYHHDGKNSLSVPNKSLAAALRRDALGIETDLKEEDKDILDYATLQLLSILADHYKINL